MARFHTSDTHMGHANISRFCNRPWLDMPIEAMNEGLIAAWNAVVRPNDTVIHYGDLALGNFVESMAACARLNGDKYLVPGNHDRVFSGDRRAERFRAAYEDAGFTILDEQITLSLYDEVTGETIDAVGCHFPYVGDSHEGDRYADLRPVDTGLPIVHGHVHDSWLVRASDVSGAPMVNRPQGYIAGRPGEGIQVNVGADAPGVNYRPLSEQQVVDLVVGRVTAL